MVDCNNDSESDPFPTIVVHAKFIQSQTLGRSSLPSTSLSQTSDSPRRSVSSRKLILEQVKQIRRQSVNGSLQSWLDETRWSTSEKDLMRRRSSLKTPPVSPISSASAHSRRISKAHVGTSPGSRDWDERSENSQKSFREATLEEKCRQLSMVF